MLHNPLAVAIIVSTILALLIALAGVELLTASVLVRSHKKASEQKLDSE